MKSKYDLSRLIYTIAFCMIIIPACDIKKDYSSNLQIVGIILLLVRSSYSFVLKLKTKVSIIQIKILWCWILLIVAFFPGYIMGNTSMDIIIECLFLFLLYYVLFPSSDMELADVMMASVVTNLYLSYRCFFELGVMPGLYQGTATNPNQMALIMLGGVLGSLYMIVNYSSILRIIGFFSFIVSSVIIFFTSSRSTMLIVVFSTMIYLLFYFKEIRQIDIFSERVISKKNFKIVVISICVILMTIYHYRDKIIIYLFEKWGNTSSSIFSGRGELWKLILGGATLTGNSLAKNSLYSINANNDFMDWMLKYGIISFIAYVFLLSVGILYLYRKFRNNKNEYIWHIIISISYIFVCMFENIHAVFGKSINILFWVVMGCVMVNGEKSNHKIDIDDSLLQEESN